MNQAEIRKLIDFHESALSQYRHLISLSTQYLEEQTIRALKELFDIGTPVAFKEVGKP